MKHKHRIKPGYEGGEYKEGNVVVLSVTQHAMWHFAEWQRKGNWEDKLAWQGLVGIIGKDEVIHTLLSEAGKRGAQKFLELHFDEAAERFRALVKKQLEDGTHPFLRDNRSWDQSGSAKKAAATQIENGVHPFQGQNPSWDRTAASKKSAETRIREGILCERDRGPNWDIVQQNLSRIREWWETSRSRKSKNGRIVGYTVCDRELNLGLTSLQPLHTLFNEWANA